MSLCDRPSATRLSVAQLSMLMKPGATARPRASISRRPRPRPVPRAVIWSPSMARSPTLGGPPDPSYSVPPRIRTPYSLGPATAIQGTLSGGDDVAGARGGVRQYAPLHPLRRLPHLLPDVRRHA